MDDQSVDRAISKPGDCEMGYPQTPAGRLVGVVLFAAGVAGFGCGIWMAAQNRDWSYLPLAAISLFAAISVVAIRLRAKKSP